MKILGIESSSLVASIALVDEEKVIAEYTINFQQTHSQILLPMIQEIFFRMGITIQDIDAIAVSSGPGSFTGLRIGSATAKGLGMALNKPLIPVPTLEAMAYGLYQVKSLICPLMDAKRQQVYTGLYEFSPEFKVVESGAAMALTEVISHINAKNREVIFLGDGTDVSLGLLQKELTVPYTLAPVYANRQRAAVLASLSLLYYKEKKLLSAKDYIPEYFRASSAERLKE
ncbi:hypothetical protein FACS189418_4830 [Clostridia bacterium]|nr:hypothetical protein FACS189418_4830 [Clostridia bacterium]